MSCIFYIHHAISNINTHIQTTAFKIYGKLKLNIIDKELVLKLT